MGIRIKLIILCVAALTSCRSDRSFELFSGSTWKPFQKTEGIEKGYVFMFLSPDCPLCHNFSNEFQSLSRTYGDSLNFMAVLSGGYYTKDEIQHYIDSFSFTPPIILDPDFDLAHELGARVTPDFVLTDADLKVKYRGKLNDWAIGLSRKKVQADSAYLEWAIHDLLRGVPVRIPETPAVGCILEYPNDQP